MRTPWLLVVVLGCSSEREQMPLTAGRALYTMRTDATVVAFSETGADYQLADILYDRASHDFHWFSIALPVSESSALMGDGIVADMTDASTGIVFTQVYGGVCNPATMNFDFCWLYERYTAGEPGLEGTIELQLAGNLARGGVDITWAGETDRFGEPLQWHQHGTSAGINVPVSGYGEASVR